MIYDVRTVEFVVYATGDFDGDGLITGQDDDILVIGFEQG